MIEESQLTSRIEALPRRIDPPRDLWDDLAARLVDQAPAPVAGTVVRFPARFLALAATLALAAGLTLWLDRAGPEASSSPTRVDVRVGRGQLYATSVELMYSGALRALARERIDAAPVLDTGTAQLSLRALQHATEEIRDALEEDPEAIYLAHLLESTHRKRVQLLRQLANATDQPAAGQRMES